MPINSQTIKNIEREAKRFFVDASDCHGWTHVERVYNLALKLGKKEKADLGVLAVAALLHDIGRKDEMKSRGKFCHAERGAELATKILSKYKINQTSVDNIIHCIISHRYRSQHLPETIEAKVLFDADKLDSIGAVGIGRSFLFAGYLKNPLYTGNEAKIVRLKQDGSFSKDDTAILEYEFKLKNIKKKILTRSGKAIAVERSKFMTAYFKRFWQEVKGRE